jgi:hypothetical protein
MRLSGETAQMAVRSGVSVPFEVEGALVPCVEAANPTNRPR